jgi:hypothetical protein
LKAACVTGGLPLSRKGDNMQCVITIDVDGYERSKGIMPYCGKCEYMNEDEGKPSCDLFNEMLTSDNGDDIKRDILCLESNAVRRIEQ